MGSERDWLVGVALGLAVAVGFEATAVAARAAAAGGPGGGAEARAARRQWALAKMDEMAGERRRCRERFRLPREVAACEQLYQRRYREYNEVYREAARE